MADNIGDLDDKLPAPEQRGMDAQVIAHENDVFHFSLKTVGVEVCRGVERDPLGTDCETGMRVISVYCHGEGSYDLP